NYYYFSLIKVRGLYVFYPLNNSTRIGSSGLNIINIVRPNSLYKYIYEIFICVNKKEAYSPSLKILITKRLNYFYFLSIKSRRNLIKKAIITLANNYSKEKII
ncbi:hypothetical protein V8F20_012777, partial [Naviculisporaceae sp. PSN 640]